MTDDIHSCGYYCERPACVRAQRDELRDRFVVPVEPAVLPKGPSCCCTDPPTKMGLTFYMDSTVGPVQRVDAQCPACGAMVKGLKL